MTGRLSACMRHPAWRGVVLGVGCAVGVGLLTRVPPVRGLEDWLHDGVVVRRGVRPTAARVVIVGVDDAALAAAGKPAAYLSPQFAEAVRHLHRQGAAAVGIDLLVPERFAGLPEVETPGGLGDAAPLGEAAVDAGNVVLPVVLGGGEPIRPLPQWRLTEFRAALSPDAPSVLLHLGFVDLTEDGDQFVRRQALLARRGDAAVPHFALALYARARGAAVEWDDANGRLTVGGEPVPLDGDQRLRIHFAGPPGSFPVVPFGTVLAAARAGRDIPGVRGAVVLIGASARGQQDVHATPYANRYARAFAGGGAGLMSGTEVHANIVATLHDRAYVSTPAWFAPWPWLLATGAGLGWLFRRLTLELGLVVVVAHHVAWQTAAHAAYALAGWRVELLSVLLLGAASYLVGFTLRWRAMRRMLGVVNSEAVARALDADPRRLDPGGEDRDLTVMFADVRDFTPFAETHTPQEVITLLNAYLAAVVPLVEAEGGVVNHYLGDGVLVLFGAPASAPDHAARAVRVATAMVRRVRQLGPAWSGFGFPGLRIGVGIHSGPAVVGCVGSPGRLEYTAIGDTVNVAARIESENKRLGTEVLISAATYEALPPGMGDRLGCAAESVAAALKGKAAAVAVHAVTVV